MVYKIKRRGHPDALVEADSSGAASQLYLATGVRSIGLSFFTVELSDTSQVGQVIENQEITRDEVVDGTRHLTCTTMARGTRGTAKS